MKGMCSTACGIKECRWEIPPQAFTQQIMKGLKEEVSFVPPETIERFDHSSRREWEAFWYEEAAEMLVQCFRHPCSNVPFWQSRGTEDVHKIIRGLECECLKRFMKRQWLVRDGTGVFYVTRLGMKWIEEMAKSWEGW
jgi:hypothetical protein